MIIGNLCQIELKQLQAFKYRCVFFALLLPILTYANCYGSSNSSISIELYDKSNSLSDRTIYPFGCKQKIFATIKFTGLENKLHNLSVDWVDPTGKVIEHIDYDFYGYDTKKITVWLKLHSPKGASLLGFLDSAIGLKEFIGTWEISALLDNKIQYKKSFEIIC